MGVGVSKPAYTTSTTATTLTVELANELTRNFKRANGSSPEPSTWEPNPEPAYEDIAGCGGGITVR